MTTPGGVPNLPPGALTLDNLESNLHDMSGTAMKTRAVERFPSIMDKSTGMNPLSDLTPFGILTRIFAEVSSRIATADPADIDGPEDLPDLLLDFIEDLPVVGQFVGILEAILGNYEGEDETLLAIQNIFAPIRALVEGAPLEAIGMVLELFQKLLNRQDSEIANLKAQIHSLRTRLDPTSTGGGGWDPCRTADGFDTPLIGTLTPTGWGAITSPGLAVAHYSESPALDRNRVGMIVKAKQVGQTGLHFCSDNDMTNYVRLLFDVTGTGRDTVSVVTGTGPNSGIVTRRSLEMRIPSDSFWTIAYEPYDEESDTSNTFHVFHGRDPVVALRWPDEGNTVIHSDTSLRWGVLINGLDNPTRRGFAVTDVSYGDWDTGAPQ